MLRSRFLFGFAKKHSYGDGKIGGENVERIEEENGAKFANRNCGQKTGQSNTQPHSHGFTAGIFIGLEDGQDSADGIDENSNN